ncbi:MAG: hypothetical protein KUA29_01940, partial [Methanobacterium sp.]|nr:hypothetical protein [Methanobacterium sp.]
MVQGTVKFYTDFYGYKFARIFRRPHHFKNTTKFRIENHVYTPHNLYLLIKHNSGFHKCLISTYSYGIEPPINKSHLKENVIIDRIFLDFDIHLEGRILDLKNELSELREYGLKHRKSRQDQIKKILRTALIDEELALPALEDAKLFAEHFNNDFDNYPTLFFSGFKGCHAYLFFEPVKLANPNLTISDFASRVKTHLKLDTMDLNVNQDPVTRLSRIPYSKHELTGLTVVPFKIDTPYEEIIKKSVNPVIESFTLKTHITDLNLHLKENEPILLKNQKTVPKKSLKFKNPPLKTYKNVDHRIF